MDVTSTKNRLHPAVSQEAPDIYPLSQHNRRPPAEKHPLQVISMKRATHQERKKKKKISNG